MRQTEVPLPYGYELFMLTKEETIKGGECLGFNYAYQNKDRWVNVDSTGYELQTYDRGFTHIFYDGKVYDLFCDYLLVEEQTRLFVARFYDSDINEIKPLQKDRYERTNKEGKTVVIKNNGSFRDLETARIQREKKEKEDKENGGNTSTTEPKPHIPGSTINPNKPEIKPDDKPTVEPEPETPDETTKVLWKSGDTMNFTYKNFTVQNNKLVYSATKSGISVVTLENLEFNSYNKLILEGSFKIEPTNITGGGNSIITYIAGGNTKTKEKTEYMKSDIAIEKTSLEIDISELGAGGYVLFELNNINIESTITMNIDRIVVSK